MQNVVHSSKCDSTRDKDISDSIKDHSVSSLPLTGNTIAERGPSLASLQSHFMAEISESDDDEISEVESFILEQDVDEDTGIDSTSKFLLAKSTSETVFNETACRLEALLEASNHLLESSHFDPSCSASTSYSGDGLCEKKFEKCSERLYWEKLRQSSLAEACTHGDIITVKKLLEEGRNVNEVTEDGESLLSLAASSGYFELAQLLLAMKANVEDRGLKDMTPLMEAANAGNTDIVKLLIQHGADVNAQTSQEKKLKDEKVKNQDMNMKSQQEIHDAIPSIVCPEGNTPLMFACAAGHVDIVRILLDAGARVEDHNENGHTPLMEAASAGHVEIAKLLVESGASINTHSNEFKESALTLACYKGHLEMVRFLLKAGADREHKTDEMHTALMEASKDGHVEVARLLLDSGAQVNMPAGSFKSPLTLAACGGHVELVMLLLDWGANIEEVNGEGYTPLMEAAREGHEKMVALLLSQGADINAQTEETQETALTLACCGNFLEVADFLIKAGADIELGASTPLMEAAQEGHLELVRYLINAGANVNATTATGDTALTYACENGHTDVADLLLQAHAKLESALFDQFISTFEEHMDFISKLRKKILLINLPLDAEKGNKYIKLLEDSKMSLNEKEDSLNLMETAMQICGTKNENHSHEVEVKSKLKEVDDEKEKLMEIINSRIKVYEEICSFVQLKKLMTEADSLISENQETLNDLILIPDTSIKLMEEILEKSKNFLCLVEKKMKVIMDNAEELIQHHHYATREIEKQTSGISKRFTILVVRHSNHHKLFQHQFTKNFWKEYEKLKEEMKYCLQSLEDKTKMEIKEEELDSYQRRIGMLIENAEKIDEEQLSSDLKKKVKELMDLIALLQKFKCMPELDEKRKRKRENDVKCHIYETSNLGSLLSLHLQSSINSIIISKGILCADENDVSMDKIFGRAGIVNCVANKRKFLELLLTSPNVENYFSSVSLKSEDILNWRIKDETVHSCLKRKNILYGIKINSLQLNQNEPLSIGLDDLDQRTKHLSTLGAAFSKFKISFRVSKYLPTEEAIKDNIQTLAKFANISQMNGLVPLMAVDLLRDGDYDEVTAEYTMKRILSELTAALQSYHVLTEGCILCLSFVSAGEWNVSEISLDSIAFKTVTTLKRCVPVALGAITFSSSGRSEVQSTKMLNLLNHLKPLWLYNYHFGRGAKSTALQLWAGKGTNIDIAQQEFITRARENALALEGNYVYKKREEHAEKTLFIENYES